MVKPGGLRLSLNCYAGSFRLVFTSVEILVPFQISVKGITVNSARKIGEGLDDLEAAEEVLEQS